MAPKKRASEPDVFELEQHKEKEEPIALGDSASLKRALDDAVIQAVVDAGHVVDHTWTDAKIALGLVSCAIAVVAYFYPKRNPDSFWLVLACVVLYTVLSSLMTVIASVCEKDAILLTKAAPGGPPALAVSSKLPRFEETYTLKIAPRSAPAAAGAGGGGGEVSLSKGVGAYFHADGHLAADAVRADAQALLQSFLGGGKKTN